MTRPPARCFTCQVSRVAWVKPRVDYCYSCLPGGPFSAPACSKCGSDAYFSEGLCEKCHPGGPSYRGSCRGCLAWGVYRVHNWHCWSCRWWQGHYPLGDCIHCGRSTRICEQGVCRLCLDQARMLQEPGRGPDLLEANRYGQQLYFANMRFHVRKAPRLQPESRRSQPTAIGRPPLAWVQVPLFEQAFDPALLHECAATAGRHLLGQCTTDGDLIRFCSDVVRVHAAKHGWSNRQRNDVIRSLRLVQLLQTTPGATVNATDVLQLSRYDGNVGSTLEVLAAAGLLIDDRVSHVERYFAGKTAHLPEPMKAQLEVWLEVMLGGSSRAPRRRPRAPQTARIHILGLTPVLQAWVDAGHESLAEITPADVLAALPIGGSRRYVAELGVRSLFTVLRARRVIFTNPTSRMRLMPMNRNVPLPLDTEAIRRALNSPDPAIALAVALVAFHALTAKQIAELKLTDIVDGRLVLGDRFIPLAAPVVVRLTAWLDHRGRTWPGSINPHLFVGRRSAPRLCPVGRQFPWSKTDLRPQALREDRILQEIHATGGDIRRICDLFGLSIAAAMRYAATLSHPDLERPPVPVPGTRHSE